MAFSQDRLVAECQQIVGAADDPAAEVEVVLSRLLTSGEDLDRAFADAPRGNTTLFSSTDLTVQHIAWPPGIGTPPHDHRMWAAVGVYRGEEHNILFERAVRGLAETEHRVVAAGEVLVLDETAVHSVTNPSAEFVCGIHVYGGDIDGISRSMWLPDGSELPREEVQPRYRAMWMSARSLADDLGFEFTATWQHEAFTAIRREVDRCQRLLSGDEARQLLLGRLREETPLE